MHHKRWISSSTFLNSSLKLILAFEYKKLSPKLHFFSDLSPFCTTLILTFLPSLFFPWVIKVMPIFQGLEHFLYYLTRLWPPKKQHRLVLATTPCLNLCWVTLKSFTHSLKCKKKLRKKSAHQQFNLQQQTNRELIL